MGPRIPTREPKPETYWAENPLLPRPLSLRWLRTAARATGTLLPPVTEAGSLVTRGEMAGWLYGLIRR